MARKLVSIQRIIDLQPISGADKIELATVLGWKVVVSKSENHKVGDLIAYVEIDTQFYAMRWLTTLFAREFDLPKAFRIWDSLLADPERFMLMYCVGAAMVKMIDEDLLKSDFAGVMGLLQNYNVSDVDKILEVANEVRIKKLKPEEDVEETTSQSK